MIAHPGQRALAGLISSDAGALLLGATDKAVRLADGFAASFSDGRDAGLIEHTVATLTDQRLLAISLGYPIMATLAGKLKARRGDCCARCARGWEVDVAAAQLRCQRVPPAKDVEGQIAVSIIVAVEEAALLMPVQWIVRRCSPGTREWPRRLCPKSARASFASRSDSKLTLALRAELMSWCEQSVHWW